MRPAPAPRTTNGRPDHRPRWAATIPRVRVRSPGSILHTSTTRPRGRGCCPAFDTPVRADGGSAGITLREAGPGTAASTPQPGSREVYWSAAREDGSSGLCLRRLERWTRYGSEVRHLPNLPPDAGWPRFGPGLRYRTSYGPERAQAPLVEEPAHISPASWARPRLGLGGRLRRSSVARFLHEHRKGRLTPLRVRWAKPRADRPPTLARKYGE